jgi:ribosomal protein S18 acetylase RimI-like enzyme
MEGAIPASTPPPIRRLSAADATACAAILCGHDLWRRYGWTPEAAARAFAAAAGRRAAVYVHDQPGEGIGGFVWLEPRGAFGRSAYLRLIGVRPDATGRGIGRILLRFAERRAARSAADLFLLVSDFNRGAQRFYEREGYQRVGALTGYVLPDVTELIYRKRLRGPDAAGAARREPSP